ncbi:MAG: acetyl ornithine aminotransferase family protein [Acidobacteria bacterium]|nr:acetyl ornithine aminotransferase family protein [Acidobacteriota bacterium]
METKMTIKAPDIKTALPGPKATAIVGRDEAAVSPSYTRDYPLVMARGEGAIVEDVDGNVFIDLAAGIAVTSTGHAHPEVVKAIIDQAQKYLHMSGTDFYYELQVKVAEEIGRISPIDGAVKCFFGNSGTEAVEACVKLARYHTKRANIIAFLGSFHGRTLGSLALTSSKALQRKGFGAMMPGVYHTPYANPYRPVVGEPGEASADAAIAYLEDQVLTHLVSPDEVAAIVVEPVQGEGGYVVPPAAFLQRLREIADKHGILLVADEVQSGMGRTGKMFACEHFGLEPDMMSIAKGIASGLPLGICAAKADVMDWTPGAHASTFGGNPLSCAAALATIKVLEDGVIRNAADVGAYLKDQLTGLMDKHPTIGDVRGLGLMIGVELVKDRKTKERAIAERDALVQELFKRGILILGAGKNAVRFAPPLVLTRDQADTSARLFSEALTVVEKQFGH